jgi:hypothetical protein
MKPAPTFAKMRGVSKPKPSSPFVPDTNSIQNNSTPDAQSELEKLAETSSGTSPYSGYRGLIPNRGRHNHEAFTVGSGLEHHNPDRDQHPAQVQQAQQDAERAAHLQSELDKSVGGPIRGGKKMQFEGGEPGANDAELYGH